MTIALSAENEQFLLSQVDAGNFSSIETAVNAVIEHVRKQHAELKCKIDHAYQQIEDGDYTDYDEEELRTLFEDLKARARSRAEPARL